MTQEDLTHVATELRPLARPMAELREDQKNARVHGDENLAAIEASLRAHGQRKPIVVKDGVVIAGNGTLRAARSLGWSSIACVEYEGPDALARAYALADNRAAEEATWDPEILALAIKEADEKGLLDATAFDREAADEVLAAAFAKAAQEAEDPGPDDPPEEAVSKPGELYRLGPHRLLCGDATNPDDVARLMEGECAALCATDPPYLVDYTGADRPDGKGKDWSGVYRESEIDDPEEFFRAVFGNVLVATREGAALYCWHSPKRHALLSRVWEELEILEHQQIIWVKPTAILGRSFWPYQHEPCIFGWRRGGKPAHDGCNSHAITTVWSLDWDGKRGPGAKEHPTQKPLEVFGIPIRKHTQRGEIVFEPFSGSGSQLIAAAQEGRRCYGLEIEPRFCDVIRRRFTKYARSAGLDPGAGGLA